MDGVIVVASDITDLVAAEAALKRAADERHRLIASEEAARQASTFKTSFVTNISHEIRTPIAAMLGIGELLLDDSSLRDDQRQLLEKSLRSGEILLELVGMVLVSGVIVTTSLPQSRTHSC